MKNFYFFMTVSSFSTASWCMHRVCQRHSLKKGQNLPVRVRGSVFRRKYWKSVFEFYRKLLYYDTYDIISFELSMLWIPKKKVYLLLHKIRKKRKKLCLQRVHHRVQYRVRVEIRVRFRVRVHHPGPGSIIKIWVHCNIHQQLDGDDKNENNRFFN